MSAPAIERAARTLTGWEILRPDPPLGFVHAMVREAVYHDLSPLERESRHALAARLLLDAGRPAEEVAAHALVLPPAGQDWVVRALAESARVAMRRGAPDIAVAHLRRAVVEPPPADQALRLVGDLGLAESLANQPQAAAPNLAAAYRAASDPPTRAHLAEVLARMLIFTTPPQDAVDVARGAGADLPSGMQDERDALTAIDLYAVSFGAVDDGVALEAAYGPSATAGRPAGPGGRMLAAVRAWDAALTGGSAASSVAEAHTALGGGALVRDDPSFMVNIAAGVLVLADATRRSGSGTPRWRRGIPTGRC